MNDPQFFGYGSLVNLKTHGYADPRPHTLRGWTRVWQQSANRPVAFLSVVPEPTSEIDGMIASVPGGDWAELDLREQAYDRKDITAEIGEDRPTAIYQAAPTHIAPAGSAHPILLSYLDVVIQGFLAHFGEAGVTRFFDTTLRWDTVILDDRKTPIYPRHQALNATETRCVDAHLVRLSAVVKQSM